MFAVIVRNKVNVEGKQEYIEISKKFAKEMVQVEGCIESKVLVSNLEQDSVINFELWRSEADFQNYNGEIFLKYKPELKKYFLGNETETFKM